MIAAAALVHKINFLGILLCQIIYLFILFYFATYTFTSYIKRVWLRIAIRSRRNILNHYHNYTINFLLNSSTWTELKFRLMCHFMSHLSSLICPRFGLSCIHLFSLSLNYPLSLFPKIPWSSISRLSHPLFINSSDSLDNCFKSGIVN